MKIKFTRSVAIRVIGLLVLLMLVYGVSLFYVIRKRVNIGVLNYISDSMQSDVNGVDVVIKETASTKLQGAQILANEFAQVNSYSTNNDFYAEELCQKIVKENLATEAAIFDNSGKKITTSPFKLSNTNAYFEGAKANKVFFDFTKDGEDLYVVYAVPVIHNNKNIGFALTKSVISSDLLISRVKRLYDIEATYFSGYTRIYTSLPNMKGVDIADKSMIDRAMAGEVVLQPTVINSKNYLASYFPIKDSAGNSITVFFIGKSIESIKVILNEIVTPVLIISSIMTIVNILLMAFMVYLVIIKKLFVVQNSMENLSSGDADLTLRIPESGHDEFAQIGKNVNTFIEMLQNMIQKLRNAQKSLAEIGEKLGVNSQETASATTEIMANIESVRRQSKNQSNAVLETSSSLQTSRGSMRDLVTLIDDQVSGIVESSAAIEQMVGNIEAVSKSVEKMADNFKILDKNVADGNSKLENVEAKVLQMAEQSAMLVQANDMIAQVASQTNLLAMNAAIEAAHAGDAGKGFSVVADEIRTLAETTTAQSKNIKEELGEITKSIQNVVELTKTSKDSFGTIVKQLSTTDIIMNEIDNAMAEQNSASQQILEALASMKTQSVSVNDKSKDVQDVIESVQSNMVVVSQVSETILGSMDEMASGSEQINASTQSVSQLALETKENISIMEQLLNQFNA